MPLKWGPNVAKEKRKYRQRAMSLQLQTPPHKLVVVHDSDIFILVNCCILYLLSKCRNTCYLSFVKYLIHMSYIIFYYWITWKHNILWYILLSRLEMTYIVIEDVGHISQSINILPPIDKWRNTDICLSQRCQSSVLLRVCLFFPMTYILKSI